MHGENIKIHQIVSLRLFFPLVFDFKYTRTPSLFLYDLQFPHYIPYKYFALTNLIHFVSIMHLHKQKQTN